MSEGMQLFPKKIRKHHSDVQTKKQRALGGQLRDYFFHYMPVDIGQTHVSAAKTKRAACVVDAQ
jgi:hypothetical protein